MSYVDRIPKEQLSDYTVVEDWNRYYIEQLSNYGPELKYGKNVNPFSNLIIKSTVLLTGEYQHSFDFFNCFFLKIVQINKATLNKGIRIGGCFFDMSFELRECIVADNSFTHINCSVKDYLSLTGGQFGYLNFDIQEVSFFTVNSGHFDVLSFRCKELIETVSIMSSRIVGRVNFYGLNVNEVFVSGYSESFIEFSEIRVNNLFVNNFRNTKEFKLSNILPLGDSTKFRINDSYLGKAEFYNVDFKSFDNVIIESSHLVDCAFVGVKLFAKLQMSPLATDEVSDPKDYELLMKEGNHKLRETYRQLKYALGKQGDTIIEQKFHTLEMRAHDKSLHWTTDFWTKLIIKLSYITSNFGQSMWWPIRALLVGHYWMYMLAIGAQAVQLNNYKVGRFNDYIYNYFYLINPLHRTEDLPKDWTIIIDIFMRIWSSYMIYNIIRASRRFIK